MVLLMGLAITNLYSQPIPPDSCVAPPVCIQNGQLTSSGTPHTTTPNMNSSAATTINNWFVSLGSPGIYPGTTGDGIYMWARQNNGTNPPTNNAEAIFTCYEFLQGHTYRICLQVRNSSSTTSGNLRLIAANGEQAIGRKFFTTIINPPASSETINLANTYSTNWQTITIAYTPNANYSQLIIMPFSTVDPGGAGQPYTVIVDDIRVAEIPTIVAAQDPIDGCTSTSLRVNGAAPGSTITWSPSTGLNTTTGAVVTAHPCTTTTYTATVTSSCANCGPETVQHTVNVNNPGGLVNNALTIQCGDPFKLEYLPVPSCAMFDWFDPNGILVSNTNDVNVTSAGPNHSGIYTLTVTYSNGCTETHTATVDVVNCCRAIANFDEGPDCNPVQFTDMSTGISTPVSWLWEFGDGTTSTKQNPRHWFKDINTFTVCLTVTYKEGSETCCDRFCKEISTCDWGCLALADFKYTSPAPRTIQFNDLSVGNMGPCSGPPFPAPSPYHWDFGDGNSSNAQNPSHTYAAPGTYDVCFTVDYCTYTLGGGIVTTCTDTYCETITVQ